MTTLLGFEPLRKVCMKFKFNIYFASFFWLIDEIFCLQFQPRKASSDAGSSVGTAIDTTQQGTQQDTEGQQGTSGIQPVFQ